MKFLLAVVVIFVVGCNSLSSVDECQKMTEACVESCKTPELTDRSVCYLNCAKVYRTCWGD